MVKTDVNSGSGGDSSPMSSCMSCGSAKGVMCPPCVACTRSYCLSCGLSFRQQAPDGFERHVLPEREHPIHAICPQGHDLGLSGDVCDQYPIGVRCSDCFVGRVKGTERWVWTCANAVHG